VGLIGIVGGGVVGPCAGLDLLEAGHGVVLVDDDPRAQAPSWGNAGHVATEQVEPLASLESLRSVPGRLFTRGGPLAFPPGAIARWMPFGMRLLAASAPARFRAGCAAMRPLMAQALPAWQARAEAIGEPGLCATTGTSCSGRMPPRRRPGRPRKRQTPAPRQSAPRPRLTLRGCPRDHPARGGRGALRARPRLPIWANCARPCARPSCAAEEHWSTKRRRSFPTGIASGSCGSPRALVLDAVDRVLVCAGIRSRALMEGLGHAVPMIAERGYHVRAKVEDGDWPADMPRWCSRSAG
jgi:D-amino-acid dehydrogenase